MSSIAAGGFLKGYRTYILSILAIASLLVSYLVGDADLATTLKNLWPIFTSLSIMSARAAIPNGDAK